MKTLFCVMLWVLWANVAVAAFEIISGEPQSLFDGKQSVQVTFHNSGTKDVEVEMRTLLVQESSATTAILGPPVAWKHLRVLAGQTVVERTGIDLPAVRAATSFQLRYLDLKTNEIGTIALRVFPRDLLKQLSRLAGEKGVGVLDPSDQLKPLFKTAQVEFHDLETGSGFDGFEGKLALIGPFAKNKPLPENLRARILGRARRTPTAIVLILPQSVQLDSFPPAYLVRESGSSIAVLHPKAVSSLDSPDAQLNLIRAAQLALNPDSARLPRLEPE